LARRLGAAAHGVRLTGIELSARDVARARDALGDGADFVCGDMRSVAFPAADTIVILDVLHYVERREQDEVLARARTALGDAGTLLLRVGDAASRRRFAASQWVDRLVFLLRGCRRNRSPVGRLGMDRASRRPRLPGVGPADVGGHAVRERAPRRHPRHATERFLSPATLDHAGIEALVPHRGTMCLLDRMVAGTKADRMRRHGHRDPDHPLRSRSGLMASTAIEYAARRRPCTAAWWRRLRARPRRRATWRARAMSGSAPGGSTTCPPPKATRCASSPSARRAMPDGSSTPFASSTRAGRSLPVASPSCSTPASRRMSPQAAQGIPRAKPEGAPMSTEPPRPPGPRHRRQRRHRPGDRRAAGARRRPRHRPCQHPARGRRGDRGAESLPTAAAPRRSPST
jgi:hypothetical protein